jgi:hypothetical protein
MLGFVIVRMEVVVEVGVIFPKFLKLAEAKINIKTIIIPKTIIIVLIPLFFIFL